MSRTFSLVKSRAELAKQGYSTWITEKPWNPYTKRREDLFNFIDLIGIRADLLGVLGIQACGEDAAGHYKKITKGYTDGKGQIIGPNPYIHTWLTAKNRFFIWSWCLRGDRGKRKLYRLREIEFLIENGQVVGREIPHEEELP